MNTHNKKLFTGCWNKYKNKSKEDIVFEIYTLLGSDIFSMSFPYLEEFENNTALDQTELLIDLICQSMNLSYNSKEVFLTTCEFLLMVENYYGQGAH